MAKSPEKFQIVYRGEVLAYYKPGEWVFFQRPKECGGGYWLGKTYDFVYMFEIPYPVSLRQGMEFMDEAEGFGAHKPASVDDFKLE